MSNVSEVGTWRGQAFSVAVQADDADCGVGLELGWAGWRRSFFVNVTLWDSSERAFRAGATFGMDDDDDVIETVDDLAAEVPRVVRLVTGGRVELPCFVPSEVLRAALVEAQLRGAPVRC